MMQKVLRAYFSGRVQGVGFRAYVFGLSKGFTLTGWVKNLPDGRVELVAYGREDELAEFLKTICQGQMAAHIHDVKSEMHTVGEGPKVEAPDTFRIL